MKINIENRKSNLLDSDMFCEYNLDPIYRIVVLKF